MSHANTTIIVTAVAILLLSSCSKQKAADSEHHHNGEHATPAGWKFRLPQGNPADGQKIFAEMESYQCHEIKGEKFAGDTEKGAGPELSQMAGMHPVEFFAESIINPTP